MFNTETETIPQTSAGVLLSSCANYLSKVFECEVIQDAQLLENGYNFHFIMRKHGVQITQTFAQQELVRASEDKARMRDIFKGLIAQIVNENPDLKEYLD